MDDRRADAPTAPSAQALVDDLERAFRNWRGEPWSEDDFGRLALRVFRLQYERCEPYRLYCRARRREPDRVSVWREIPPVPTEAFRHVEFRTFAGGSLRFRTSGTTRGTQGRGTHLVPDPGLYRASLRAAFGWLVLGDSGDRIRITSLVPPFADSGESSLAWMIEDLAQHYGRQESGSCADSSGIDWRMLAEACESARGKAEPLCLFGTTLAFASWLDVLEREDGYPSLPDGSLLVDTGGAKGRSGLRRPDLLDRLLPRLGLTADQAINEFGMTELLSQRYGRGMEEPRLLGPPWLRTVVLDPVNLEPCRSGEEGILCHFDLANAGSVMAVLTEDRGRLDGDALVLLGRSEGAPPRGCSLATAEILSVRAGG